MFKRFFDIIFSLVLLVCLLPVFIVVAILLKCTGDHEIWYLQDRVGLGGSLFKVFKFVTMRQGKAEPGTEGITLRNDPRVLPIGRFLRTTKVNELPQLINVLLGQMSFVGWRPLLPSGFSCYPPEIQEKLIGTRPGITGIGSIVFRDEEAIIARSDKDPLTTYAEDIAPYKGALECWYLENQSLWLDLKLFLLTALALLAPRTRLYLRWFPNLPQPTTDLVARYLGETTGRNRKGLTTACPEQSRRESTEDTETRTKK